MIEVASNFGSSVFCVRSQQVLNAIKAIPMQY